MTPSAHGWAMVKGAASTPAFVYDEGGIVSSARGLAGLCDFANCKPLYTLKAFCILDALRLMVPYVSGFAASSLFEARLGRQAVGHAGTVHLTTPGLLPDEVDAIAETCDYIAFNSLSQWERLRAAVAGRAASGLRANPKLSFVNDDRYNPCREHSKLGVPMDQLRAALDGDAGLLDGVSGILFHTNCDSETFAPLLATVQHLDARLSDLLDRVEWVNLGGGYLPSEAGNIEDFYRAVQLLRQKYDVEVFFEPGAAVVREAGYLVASALDMFESDGKAVVILDTTVNHMPEVFEYQFRPDVVGDVAEGRHRYIPAGCTCLAGDLFGEYAFDEPLEVGSRVVFSSAGAYTMVKAHMFNGVNLPTIYALTEAGELVMKKRFTYQDFASRCGGHADACA